MEIVTVEVSPIVQNCRLIADRKTRNCIVIDPGGDIDRIWGELQKREWQCKEIWLTHSHMDHCGGVKQLKDRTGARVFAHPLEYEYRARVEEAAIAYGMAEAGFENCPEPDVFIEGGEVLDFCGHQFKVAFTPGHSPGHVVFYQPENEFLIAGDTVFAGSIGRTDLPGGSHRQLLASIREHILPLPDDTRILSGHGPDTTVGIERKGNPFLTKRCI